MTVAYYCKLMYYNLMIIFCKFTLQIANNASCYSENCMARAGNSKVTSLSGMRQRERLQ